MWELFPGCSTPPKLTLISSQDSVALRCAFHPERQGGSSREPPPTFRLLSVAQRVKAMGALTLPVTGLTTVTVTGTPGGTSVSKRVSLATTRRAEPSRGQVLVLGRGQGDAVDPDERAGVDHPEAADDELGLAGRRRYLHLQRRHERHGRLEHHDAAVTHVGDRDVAGRVERHPERGVEGLARDPPLLGVPELKSGWP